MKESARWNPCRGERSIQTARARASTDGHGPTRTPTDTRRSGSFLSVLVRAGPCPSVSASGPGGDRDDAQAAAGDQRVQAAEHGHHHVEELELRAAEVPPLEDLAVQEPARHREVVEVA